LVVDDNVDAANTMSMLLEVASYAVSVEHSAAAALSRAAAEAPKVLLVDIGLPDMDGYELAGRLRQLPQLSNSVLIAVTGYGQEQDITRAHDAGFAFHMLKPVDIQQLYALLRQVALDYRQVHAQ
jgi:CheY-like chemotaxis protein